MNISGSNYINNSVLKSLTDKTQKITDEKNEALAPQPSTDEIVTARKYDVLEKSRDYEDMKLTEKPEEEMSEIERIRGMFSVTGAMSKMFSDLFETGKGFGEDDIVEICGAIGSEIDKSHASGKLTDEEFDILNKELDDYAEAITERTVLFTAWGNMIQDNLKEKQKITQHMIEQKYLEKRFQTFREEMKQFKLSLLDKNKQAALWADYINSYDIDRRSLFDMIRNARISMKSSGDVIDKWNLNEKNAEHVNIGSGDIRHNYAKFISVLYRNAKTGKGIWGDAGEQTQDDQEMEQPDLFGSL